jgi:hypothetical protein
MDILCDEEFFPEKGRCLRWAAEPDLCAALLFIFTQSWNSALRRH